MSPCIKDCLNTVPNCQNLHKNSFNYHTVTADPGGGKEVPLEECMEFIERSRLQAGAYTRPRFGSS